MTIHDNIVIVLSFHTITILYSRLGENQAILLKEIAHPKMAFHPFICFVDSGSFLKKSILELHGQKEFYPTDSGHILQLNKENKRRKTEHGFVLLVKCLEDSTVHF